jgi:hypothetical protein
MVNGKTPLYLTLASLALFGAAMLLRQPYSADWPGTAYAEPAGERRGDTTEVFVYPPGPRCDESPIVFRFVGGGPRARVLHASSDCLDR